MTSFVKDDSKLSHISIEDAGFDKTTPPTNIQRLYDDEEVRDISVITSQLNLEFERIICPDADNDGQSLNMNQTIQSY